MQEPLRDKNDIIIKQWDIIKAPISSRKKGYFFVVGNPLEKSHSRAIRICPNGDLDNFSTEAEYYVSCDGINDYGNRADLEVQVIKHPNRIPDLQKFLKNIDWYKWVYTPNNKRKALEII